MQAKTQSSATPLGTKAAMYSPGETVIYTNKNGKRLKAEVELVYPSKGCKVKLLQANKSILAPMQTLEPLKSSSKPRSGGFSMFNIGDEVEYLGGKYKITAINQGDLVTSYELDGVAWVTSGITKVKKPEHWSDNVPESMLDVTAAPSRKWCTCGEQYASGMNELDKHSSWCDLVGRK